MPLALLNLQYTSASVIIPPASWGGIVTVGVWIINFSHVRRLQSHSEKLTNKIRLPLVTRKAGL